MRKLPHVTALFWVLKIVTTMLGETGGDLLAQTLQVGYLVSTVIFFALLLIFAGCIQLGYVSRLLIVQAAATKCDTLLAALWQRESWRCCIC